MFYKIEKFELGFNKFKIIMVKVFIFDSKNYIFFKIKEDM